jgi:hypothetical protein
LKFIIVYLAWFKESASIEEHGARGNTDQVRFGLVSISLTAVFLFRRYTIPTGPV